MTRRFCGLDREKVAIRKSLFEIQNILRIATFFPTMTPKIPVILKRSEGSPAFSRNSQYDHFFIINSIELHPQLVKKDFYSILAQHKNNYYMRFHTIIFLAYTIPGLYLFTRLWLFYSDKSNRLRYISAFIILYAIYPLSSLFDERGAGAIVKVARTYQII